MANGYEPGEYFAQFLSQLPAMYRAKEGVAMQKRYITLAEKKYADALEQQKVANQLARQNYEYKVGKYQQDMFNKERDEEQDVMDDMKAINPEMAMRYAATPGKIQYNPQIKSFAEQYVQKQDGTVDMVNDLFNNADMSYDDRITKLESIRTSGLSESSKKVITDSATYLKGQRNSEAVSMWLSQNRNNPDYGRISLLPKEDAYKEILEKNPAAELRSDLNTLTSISTVLINDELVGGLDAETKELYKGIQSSKEKKIRKAIAPVTVIRNNEVMNEATLQIMKQFPQFFTKDEDGKPIPKPAFQKAAQDSVNNLYNRLIKNQ